MWIEIANYQKLRKALDVIAYSVGEPCFPWFRDYPYDLPAMHRYVAGYLKLELINGFLYFFHYQPLSFELAVLQGFTGFQLLTARVPEPCLVAPTRSPVDCHGCGGNANPCGNKN